MFLLCHKGLKSLYIFVILIQLLYLNILQKKVILLKYDLHLGNLLKVFDQWGTVWKNSFKPFALWPVYSDINND